MHRWDLSPTEAVALQHLLAARVDPHPPPGWMPRLVAGADISMERLAARAYAGIVVIDAGTMETVEEVAAEAEVHFPYVPGLLSFRELPALLEVWERLERRPDVVIFDGVGYAHPRRFGIASHGGVLLDLPTIGCAKSILVGKHEPLGEARGSTAPLVHRGEVVGMAVRLRDRTKPVYVSAGHRMDLETAVALVQRMGAGFREPETTRRAHRLVNARRRAAKGSAGAG